MSQIKEQFGVLILVAVLVILLIVMWVFRGDHDVVLSVNQWIAGVIGGILGLVTGKNSQQHATQTGVITNTGNTQVVEAPPKE